jgi:hypothetical protein
MEILLIVFIVAGLGLFLFLGYKGAKDSKNKPPQIK